MQLYPIPEENQKEVDQEELKDSGMIINLIKESEVMKNSSIILDDDNLKNVQISKNFNDTLISKNNLQNLISNLDASEIININIGEIGSHIGIEFYTKLIREMYSIHPNYQNLSGISEDIFNVFFCSRTGQFL